MNQRQCTALWVSMMHLQKSWTLHWHSYLGGRSDVVDEVYTQNGSPHIDYGFMLSHSGLIIEDARAKIIDAPLTLIFKRLEWCRHYHLCPQWQPILWSCVTATMSFVWLSASHDQIWFTHRWHSFPGWVNKSVTILCTYKNCQYSHFGRMWLCSHLVAENVGPKLVDTQLNNILAVSGCSTTVCKNANRGRWQRINRFYVNTFASQSVQASQFLTHH